MATCNLDSSEHPLHIKRLLFLLALSLCHLLLFSSPPLLSKKKAPNPLFSCAISLVTMDSCTSDIPSPCWEWWQIVLEIKNSCTLWDGSTCTTLGRAQFFFSLLGRGMMGGGWAMEFLPFVYPPTMFQWSSQYHHTFIPYALAKVELSL